MNSGSVEIALVYLRKAILEGWLTPGEKVNQHKIAAQTGVSRIPVREALGILAAEGSLVYLRNRGYAVPKLQVDELAQIYRMRTLIEDDLVANLERPDPQNLKPLLEMNKEMKVAVSSGDLPTFVRLNREFHLDLLALSNQPMIVAEVDRLWAMSDGYRALYLYAPNTATKACRDHVEIIAALKRGDMKQLTALLHQHRWGAQDHVMRILSARESTYDRHLTDRLPPPGLNHD